MIEFLVYLITIAGIWGILSLSLNFQYGVTGLVNLGHVGFFMLGAYISTIVVVLGGLPIGVGMLAGIFAAALYGILIALPTANLQQDYWAISTLAAAEIIRIIFLNTPLGGPYVGEAFGAWKRRTLGKSSRRLRSRTTGDSASGIAGLVDRERGQGGIVVPG